MIKGCASFCVQKGKQGNLPDVKKTDRIRMISGILRHAPAYNGEMTDRPNITQNIIATMSNNEIIIEICRKNALREN